MTGLREELGRLIEDDDERWYAFGFDKSSDPSTPEVPGNITVTPGAPGGGMLFFNWPDSRRAVKYRVVLKNATTGAELVNVLVEDSEATITGLASGTNTATVVTARNNDGDKSQPSAAVQAVMP